MLKYVLKQFFNNKKSFILIVILLITFIITSISPYLTGLFVDFLISNKNRQISRIFVYSDYGNWYYGNFTFLFKKYYDSKDN